MQKQELDISNKQAFLLPFAVLVKPRAHAPIQKGEQGGLIEQVLKLLRVLF